MRTRIHPATITFLIALFAVSAWFVVRSALHYVIDYSPSSFGPYWSTAPWMRAHAAAGIVALLAGCSQLMGGMLAGTGIIHRWIGRLYLASVLIAASAALVVVGAGSAVSPLFGAMLCLQTLLWTIFTALGWLAARRRRWLAHRQWMTRSLALALGFVLFRLLAISPLLADRPFAERFTTLQALLLPALLAGTELLLQWRETLGSRPPGQRIG